MGRAPCCDKGKVKKGPWSPEEDTKLKSYIQLHGTGGNWIALPHKIGLKRCGKSCRLRWLNYLRPNIKHGGFTEDEDNLICTLYISIGSRWSIIASQLPGRTDNDIKNYWNTRLKKKLLANHHSMPAYNNNNNNNNNNVLIHEQLQAKSISSFENKYNIIPAGFDGIQEEYSMTAGGGVDLASSSDLPENVSWGPTTTVCGPNIPQDWTLLFDEPSLLHHHHNDTFFPPYINY